MEKITLIVPVYNDKEYIRNCLDSAICQSYGNYEILVVDDGSTDCSYDICRAYQDHCDFLRIIHRSENRGLVYSWQEGVSAATGDYIAFLDSDDWVDSQYLEKLASGIPEGADIVCCNYNRVFGDRMILQTERIKPGCYTRDQIHREVFPVLLNDGTYLGRGISPHRCGKLFRRELLLDNLKYCNRQISYGEDLNIFFAAIMDCRKLLVLEDPTGLYYYRQNEASIIHTYKREMYQQIQLLRSRLFEIMEAKSCHDFTDQLNADFWCLFLEYVKNETKASSLFRSAGEVSRNFANMCREIPWQKIAMKPTDRALVFCLRRNRWFLYLWMKLYSFAKKV